MPQGVFGSTPDADGVEIEVASIRELFRSSYLAVIIKFEGFSSAATVYARHRGAKRNRTSDA